MTAIRAILLSALLGVCAGAWQENFDSAAVDAVIEEAIGEEQIPGAVLLVGHKGEVLHRKAYGERSVTPTLEPMTVDTIFDAASLTKVVATAPSVMRLFERGQIRLNDRVTEYLPDFQNGKSRITVRHLLTHFSGLRPDVDIEPVWSGYETGIRKALVDEPIEEPGQRFIYSDINYLLLAEMVRKLTGQRIEVYAKENIFEPLGMKDTSFQPAEEVVRRIAPTEVVRPGGEPLRGVVHDPTTRFMNGVAGHAGMFTTADDLGRFAQMMLGAGSLHGKQVLRPLTVRKMITPQSPADQPVLRGLGWDLDSPYSGNRGELFPLGSFGHTGFTGTSIWIDPVTETYVILMTNRVHPRNRGSVTSLRARVSTAVAAELGVELPGVNLTGYNETLVGAGSRRRVERTGDVRTGLDAAAAGGFPMLKGKRVGLITNHTGLDRSGNRNIDVMVAAGVRLEAILAPEHGVSGAADDDQIGHSTDEKTGIRVLSLYEGERRRPTAEMLEGLDVVVFDIQDVGARFYTYMCTMLNAMEEAAKHGVAFVVLDRPNPITGVHVEGPMLDEDKQSFVGCFPLPLRHGMTLGEIARMVNAERKIGVKLEVVTMRGWQRGDWFDSTNLVWTNPSPNMRSLNAALLYPGLAMLEGSRNYSVGRGTDSPFEQIGAAWIVGRELAAHLNARKIPGIRVYPTRFEPAAEPLKGVAVEGVRFVITDREIVNSTRIGLEVAAALVELYPDKIEWSRNVRLIGNGATIQALRDGGEPRSITADQQESLDRFLVLRKRFLLYR